jgi:hypothetical protein
MNGSVVRDDKGILILVDDLNKEQIEIVQRVLISYYFI